MVKLVNDKAYKEKEIREFKEVGKSTLQMAYEVTGNIENCIKRIDGLVEQIPISERDSGVVGKLAKIELKIDEEKKEYTTERGRLVKALQHLDTEIPQHDMQCANQMEKLAYVSDRIYNQLMDLDRFLHKDNVNLNGDEFREKIKQIVKSWSGTSEELSKILEAVKKGLKGMELASCQYSEDPVNLSTGNFVYGKTDLSIRGDCQLEFRRFYNALDLTRGVLGLGWIHNYELFLEWNDDKCHLHLEDGKEEVYEADIEGKLVNVRGSLNNLTELEDRYILERFNGKTDVFDKEGKYVEHIELDGRGIQFIYDAEGRLVQALEKIDGQNPENAFSLRYFYDQNGFLSRVVDHSGRTIEFTYEEMNLAEVRGLENTIERYCYDDKGHMTHIYNAGNTAMVKNSYDKNGRVKKQVFPDANHMKYRYLDDDRQIELTERNGARIVYCHDYRYRNTKTIYQNGEEEYIYNRNNQKTSFTDKNGNRTIYAYDDKGNLAKVIDPKGNRTVMTYNDKGCLLKLSLNGKEKVKNRYSKEGDLLETVDAEGHKTCFKYDEKRRVTEITQANGDTKSIVYDIHGNIIRITNGRGVETCYQYDNLNRVIESKDGNGNITKYGYNERNQITSVTNAAGDRKYYTYNGLGKLVKMVNYDGSVMEYQYDEMNRLCGVIDQEGNCTRYIHDAMWNVTQVIDAEGGEKRFIYNQYNLLDEVIDAEGNITKYDYDACGNRIMIREAGNIETKFYYDELNRMVKLEHPDGIVMNFLYDAEGNVLQTSDNLGNCREMTYNNKGERLSDSNGITGTMRYLYDAMGNVVEAMNATGKRIRYYYQHGLLNQITYPDGTWEQYSYDGCDNVISKERSDGSVILYTYDCLNRLICMESNTGQKKRLEYDSVGNIIAITDVSGNRWTYAYDKKGKLIKVRDAERGVTEYRYDRNGMLHEVWQGVDTEDGNMRKVVRYERNLLGQVTGITDALGKSETFSYDKLGRMETKIDRSGFRTSYQYNLLGQPVQIDFSDGLQANYTYNALHQLVQVNDWNGCTTFKYNENRQLIGVLDSNNREVCYTYGEYGKCTSMTYPDGSSVNYEYDEMQRLCHLNAGDNEVFYGYDRQGRLTSKRTNTGLLTEYEYSSRGLLQSLIHKRDEAMIESYCYQYDSAGNRVLEQRYRKDMESESGEYAYEYDGLHRLIKIVKDNQLIREYQYDTFGNRIKKVEGEKATNYQYNALNQLICEQNEKGKREYRYDDRGNLIRVSQEGKILHSYTFDARNRMIRAVDDSSNIAEYYYNGLGRRIGMSQGQIVNDLRNPVVNYQGEDISPDIGLEWLGKSEYVLDYTKRYNNVVQKQENDVLQSYYWDDDVLFMKTAEESYCYLNDMQGSVTRLLNQQGQIAASYGYDEFGQEVTGSPEELQPFSYTGYQRDKVSGTYYAQVREYDAAVGRFISEDPIGYARNWYTYCSNNPFFYIDRMGLSDVDIAPSELEAVADKVRDTGVYKIFVEATQSGDLNPVLSFFDFEEDNEGIYHTNKDCWQSVFGYNKIYDYVFDAATDMDVDNYDAKAKSGETYIIWLWKGDYTNLGAGAETGIYENGIAEKHWVVDKANSVPMTLSLYDKDGGQIYDYRPKETQWWITGFQPDLQNVDAADLTAVGTIDLSGNDELWEAFYNKYKNKAGIVLCFDEDSQTIWYRW